LTRHGITSVVGAFADSARRALEGGFKVIELHAAHGYLLHQFLSPISNRRSDRYGGSFQNRIRLTIEVVDAVRAVMPDRLPLWLRVSATDWVLGGWTLEETVELSRLLAGHGVDLIDCSSGGTDPGASIPVGPGYQTAFAERVRREASIPTGAGGDDHGTGPGRWHHPQRTVLTWRSSPASCCGTHIGRSGLRPSWATRPGGRNQYLRARPR